MYRKFISAVLTVTMTVAAVSGLEMGFSASAVDTAATSEHGLGYAEIAAQKQFNILLRRWQILRRKKILLQCKYRFKSRRYHRGLG